MAERRGGGIITPDEARRALQLWLRAAPGSNVKHAANRALTAFVQQYPLEQSDDVVGWLGAQVGELIREE